MENFVFPDEIPILKKMKRNWKKNIWQTSIFVWKGVKATLSEVLTSWKCVNFKHRL